MMLKYKLILLFFIGVTAAVPAGCNQHVPLKGKVTFADDGSPVGAGVVIFDDGAVRASGPIRQDGTYVVGFEKEGNGIPPGTYQVVISGAVKMLDNPTNFFPAPTEMMIHSKYLYPHSSGLSLVVDKTTREYNIEVERPQ